MSCKIFGIFNVFVIINPRQSITVNDVKYEYAKSPIDSALNRKKAIDAITTCAKPNRIRRTFLLNEQF